MDIKISNIDVSDIKNVIDKADADANEIDITACVNSVQSYTSIYKYRRPLPYALYNKNYNAIRRSHAIALSSCFMHHEEFKMLEKDEKDQLVRKVERSSHNKTCDYANKKGIVPNWHNSEFVKIYQLTMYKIQKNIADNSAIVTKLLNKSIDPNNIAYMDSHELCPEKTKMIYDQIENRKRQKVIKKYTKQYTCFKCGGNIASTFEMQARSLDEGSTLRITCEMEECPNVWYLST
jgi:DNA-directed RNA polymerase subunit M/transcription elongation factor TFIIS